MADRSKPLPTPVMTSHQSATLHALGCALYEYTTKPEMNTLHANPHGEFIFAKANALLTYIEALKRLHSGELDYESRMATLALIRKLRKQLK